MKRILAAIDGSDSSDRALAAAAGIAAGCNAALHILTIVEMPSREELRELKRVEDISVDQVLQQSGQEELKRSCDRAKDLGVRSISLEVATGDPAQRILDAATGKFSDMIVVGRRGRGRLAGLLIGSVSQKLVSLAPCAVLVVP